jgi:HSP20 family molecular chaperone IbpA
VRGKKKPPQKITKLTMTVNKTNPLQLIDKTLNEFFNLTPVFHSLDEIYRTGDQVRFSQSDNGLEVQVDLPGVSRENLELSTDIEHRDVYITARRTVKTHDGAREQTYNRSFCIGREFDIDNIKFEYRDGVLEVNVPRRKKEQHIRKYTLS